MRTIWEQRRASYQGKYVRFTDVESYPKPVQEPLPIYSGGNVDGSMRRAAELCQGWLPAKIGPAKIAEGRAKVVEYARAVGRDPGTIVTALQSVVCLGTPPSRRARRSSTRRSTCSARPWPRP
jgi:alkanesulfonate monooxygenase SsuD/methylene tetrahydromethanopterin reductase-like flavin-dependent oxidoreductase (luciferase family)